MSNSNKRYDPIVADFCSYKFQSVRVDDVDYYPIALLPKDTNGIDGFQNSQDKASQEIKRILGKDFRTTKIAISSQDSKAVCLDEESLYQLIKLQARKLDCEFCWRLLEASVGVQLRMTNDHAYGKAEEIQYYIELAAIRAEGIKYRRLFTDVVKMQKELGYELNYGYMTLIVYQCTELIEKFNAWKEVYPTRADKRKNPFRGTLNQLELEQLSNFELRAAERAIAKKIPIVQAIKDTRDFFS